MDGAAAYLNELLILGSAVVAFFLTRSLPALLTWLVLISYVVFSSAVGIHIGASPYFDLVSTPYRLLFAGITLGLAAVIALYAHFYFAGSAHRPRFFRWYSSFVWCCLLTLFADHILLFVTGWELTAVTSAMLIAFNANSPGAVKSAITALVVTGLGGLFLMAGLLWLSQTRGSSSLSVLTTPWPELMAQPYFIFAMIAIWIAAFSKSAIFPFSFWLPQAMVAPSPVSALLHSASLVNLGIFLLGMFAPLFRICIAWHIVLTGAGLLTFALGSLLAVFHNDLKKVSRLPPLHRWVFARR